MHIHNAHCHHHDSSQPMNFAFGLAVLLNILMVAAEAVGGYLSGSMALLADAGHNLSDVAGLILAWFAHWLSSVRRYGQWTYGWRSATIVASLSNGILIAIAIVGVTAESIHRLITPQDFLPLPVIVVATLAAILNFATASLLHAGAKHDLNIRGARLHMLADAAVSMAVVIGGLIAWIANWQPIDLIISFGICLVLIPSTWRLLRDSTSLLLHAAPPDVRVNDVEGILLAQDDVAQILDLHIWSLSTSQNALTASLLCPNLSLERHDLFVSRLHDLLLEQFNVQHSTIEIVRDLQAFPRACSLNEEVVA